MIFSSLNLSTQRMSDLHSHPVILSFVYPLIQTNPCLILNNICYEILVVYTSFRMPSCAISTTHLGPDYIGHITRPVVSGWCRLIAVVM